MKVGWLFFLGNCLLYESMQSIYPCRLLEQGGTHIEEDDLPLLLLYPRAYKKKAIDYVCAQVVLDCLTKCSRIVQGTKFIDLHYCVCLLADHEQGDLLLRWFLPRLGSRWVLLLTAKDASQTTILHHLARRGKVEGIAALLDHSVYIPEVQESYTTMINAADQEGRTFLDYLCEHTPAVSPTLVGILRVRGAKRSAWLASEE